ncbi:MAG TPA: HAD-IA family hydrolase [Ktedonosporobacter sp.]|jgi:phosphoglycolate phosphatase-like HAD superfamily hydrolase|nr:HAD-IA family hydrolase [Ktedonosporobacter sp.]
MGSHSKPAPDVMAIALRRLGVAPDEVVMVGDMAFDIESAAQAGVKTIAFRCGGWSDGDLAGAICIYDGPAALLAHYGTSPLVKGVSVGASE